MTVTPITKLKLSFEAGDPQYLAMVAKLSTQFADNEEIESLFNDDGIALTPDPVERLLEIITSSLHHHHDPDNDALNKESLDKFIRLSIPSGGSRIRINRGGFPQALQTFREDNPKSSILPIRVTVQWSELNGMGTSHSANDVTTNGSISVARGYDCEEDFDYIGTGGFLIECGNERELLGVTKEQAELITKHSPFFQKCLQPRIERLVDNAPSTPGAGGLAMREATSKIIRKPDWSLALARHLIEILTKGKTTLPNLGLVKGILSAGDQALVDLRLSSLVNYLDPCSRENNFCSLVDHTFFRFQLRGTVKSDEWLELLDQDVLLFREETNFVVQIFQNKAFDRDQSLSRRKLDNKISDFSVHAKRPIQALLEIERCLSSDRSNEMQEAFSIYFETTEAIQTEHHELIDRLAGGEAYVRTCADAADYQTEGYTVKASLDVLARAVQPIREETIMHCAFRVDHPSPDTLGRFINACLQAKDYPRTLGLDASIHRYFCQKSIGDIKGILEYMRDYSTSSKIKTNDFLLLLLSKESKCF